MLTGVFVYGCPNSVFAGTNEKLAKPCELLPSVREDLPFSSIKFLQMFQQFAEILIIETPFVGFIELRKDSESKPMKSVPGTGEVVNVFLNHFRTLVVSVLKESDLK
jgi:hypothetical protein